MSSNANPQATFHRRSQRAASAVSASDRSSNVCNVKIEAATDAGIDGRPLPDGNRSANALAYATSGVLAALGAVLLTARIETGEANIGSALPLQTIAAAVIGGVSLRGGSGNVINAVLGAIFIGLVVNGMNLAQITSYYQMIVLGVVLAAAVVADRLRQRMAAAVLVGKV